MGRIMRLASRCGYANQMTMFYGGRRTSAIYGRERGPGPETRALQRRLWLIPLTLLDQGVIGLLFYEERMHLAVPSMGLCVLQSEATEAVLMRPSLQVQHPILRELFHRAKDRL